MEATYINKHDTKNIICLPTQTSCCMGCKFCHITDISSKIILRNITNVEIEDMVNYIFKDLQLSKDKMLLISFMGCGEPLLNVYNLIESMSNLDNSYNKIRFAIATSMPANNEDNFTYFTHKIWENKLNVKLHLSLHYTNDKTRKQWMPSVDSIVNSLNSIYKYKEVTGNNIEIHYTLIDNVNDTEEDIRLLTKWFSSSDIFIKFLRYNAKNSIQSTETPFEKAKHIMKVLNNNNVNTEYYIPPARDIGGSCGQILVKEYLEHNKRKIQ